MLRGFSQKTAGWGAKRDLAAAFAEDLLALSVDVAAKALKHKFSSLCSGVLWSNTGLNLEDADEQQQCPGPCHSPLWRERRCPMPAWGGMSHAAPNPVGKLGLWAPKTFGAGARGVSVICLFPLNLETS